MSQDKAEQKREMAKRYDKIRREFKSKLDPRKYPGTVSLIYELDTRVCLITSDGETIMGELSSFDTFGNVVISKARGRVYRGSEGFMDIPYGTCFFSAEQVMAVGSIDEEKEKEFFEAIRPKEPEPPAQP